MNNGYLTRSVAGDGGTQESALSLPAVTEGLEQIAAGDVASEDAVAVLVRAAELVAGGELWLAPRVLDVTDGVVAGLRHEAESDVAAQQRVAATMARLRHAVEPVLVAQAGCDPHAVEQILALANEEWEAVWTALPGLVLGDAIERACDVAEVVARWFEVDPVASWVDDVGELLRAARQRGVEAAITEHHLVFGARAALLDESVPEDERAGTCGRVTAQLGEYFDQTGAVWVLRAAIPPGLEAYTLTPQRHPDRATYATIMSGLLVQAVAAGVVAPEALSEAVGYLREAYSLLPQGHPGRAGIASSLGILLDDAVQPG